MRIRNIKGFSLLELMIALAIVAIMSTMAIPSYKSFQAKARQKEGFNLLNTYFMAATATKAEFGFFPGDLMHSGFQPVGTINYRLRANDGTDIPNLPPSINCEFTEQPCDCSGLCPSFKTWVEMPFGGPGTRGSACVLCNGCPGGPLVTTDNTFRAGVAAWLATSSAAPDVYNITHTKEIEMCSDGLK